MPEAKANNSPAPDQQDDAVTRSARQHDRSTQETIGYSTSEKQAYDSATVADEAVETAQQVQQDNHDTQQAAHRRSQDADAPRK